MSQAVATQITRPLPTAGTTGSLIPKSLPEAMRMAEVMSEARMVPKHLQGDVGSCFMIIEQSQRWNMSPFLVAQCTSNIGGKLCYEGKLIAAAITSTGGIIGEFDYKFEGNPKDPKTLVVIVSATRSSDRQRKELRLAWIDAKTDNKYWLSQPEQQLVYAGSRVWARRWTPGPMLGVYAPEEVEETGELRPVATIDAEVEPVTAAPETPPATQTVDPHESLRSDADGAAAKGTAAYALFWKTLTKPQQNALLPDHNRRKDTAAAADVLPPVDESGGMEV
jgi:hypothetical protein